ncbi:MAG: PEP-CTERM sorting domain-containing protein [Leptothrix sp. (in: b-proteobacteria)]
MLKYLACCAVLLSTWEAQAVEVSFSQKLNGDFFQSFSVGGPGNFSATISSTPYFLISNVYVDNDLAGALVNGDWIIQSLGLGGGNHTLAVHGSGLGGVNGNLTYTPGNLTPTPAVPEPETAAMLVVGLGVIGALVRRNKNRR